MQIEHITTWGSFAMRNTENIAQEVIDLMQPFQIKEGQRTIPFPDSSILVNITATQEGALFTLEKNHTPCYTNACCFEAGQSATIFGYVKELVARDPLLKHYLMLSKNELQTPVLPQWLYTAPHTTAALVMTPDEMILSGEVELYIYYALYLARQY